ncbi:hypothetical protein PSHT_16434 [Puccinia striiformis]|uniref:FAM192A/Fyv6 N-terminal domain-containing protein n=1 Tax=Puccinia striiformis TaxID=27350 RepID=A0A2S4U9X4_9BASI|nr:hypothetical protein PSHT_16434 [Puccinia striiformis]
MFEGGPWLGTISIRLGSLKSQPDFLSHSGIRTGIRKHRLPVHLTHTTRSLKGPKVGAKTKKQKTFPENQDMADEPINLVLSSQVASRFVSSSDLETAREPPPMPNEDYDGRSLYEKLKETKDKKQEAFEEKLKFKNQFRALDDEEVAFLDDAAEEQRAIEIAKQEEIQKEMRRFKENNNECSNCRLFTYQSIEISSSSINNNNIAAVAVPETKTKTTTMIPKKSRKAKDFQRAFLAGAIRPKSHTVDHQGGSLNITKKRKSLDTHPGSSANHPITSPSHSSISPVDGDNLSDSSQLKTNLNPNASSPDSKKLKKT